MITKTKVIVDEMNQALDNGLLYNQAYEYVANKLGLTLDDVITHYEEHLDEADLMEDDGQPDELQEWHDFDPDC